MAELATIARPYAEALFKASLSDLDGTAVWLDELAVIAGHPKLLQFAENPKITVGQVFDLVMDVVKDPLPDMARNFLRTVIENGRLAVLPEMAAQFRGLKNAQGGASDAVVYSAFPMDDAVLLDVTAMLESRFARKLNVSVKLDRALIGGIRVVVGDEVLDTSVKARLEQMKVALTA
jgi:F-type H+-transporting ATPase subunit delta